MQNLSDSHVHEFDCADCGRHIVAFEPHPLGYCATCIALPGWFYDLELRQRLCPDASAPEVHD